MKVEKAKGGGFYLICSEKEFKEIKPFLNRYGMLDKHPELIKDEDAPVEG